MLFAFFNSKGMIYSHIVPKGSAVNKKIHSQCSGQLSEAAEEEEAVMVEQEW
jgi:hypothetical protein